MNNMSLVIYFIQKTNDWSVEEDRGVGGDESGGVENVGRGGSIETIILTRVLRFNSIVTLE